MLDSSKNQHFSCSNLTNWGVTMLYNSTYMTGYTNSTHGAHSMLPHSRCSSASTECCSHSTANARNDLLKKVYMVPTKKNFRRFPRKYILPTDMHNAKPSINTSWWFLCHPSSSDIKEGPISNTAVTPQTLHGASQRPIPLALLEATRQPSQPYLKHSVWKY